MRAGLFTLLLTALSIAPAEPLVVRNGHHRAIAVIALLKSGKISPDLVVGYFGERSVTAGELVAWYDNNQLLAYNRAHTPALAEDIIKSFDPKPLLEAGDSNTAGGIRFSELGPDEKLQSFGAIPVNGNYFSKPDCRDTIQSFVR